MNMKADKGSPCRRPRLGVIFPLGWPLNKTCDVILDNTKEWNHEPGELVAEDATRRIHCSRWKHYHLYTSTTIQDIPSSSWSTTKQVACVCSFPNLWFSPTRFSRGRFVTKPQVSSHHLVVDLVQEYHYLSYVIFISKFMLCFSSFSKTLAFGLCCIFESSLSLLLLHIRELVHVQVSPSINLVEI